jgi:pimeloyl-ACP methyl ester carboxylesterase
MSRIGRGNLRRRPQRRIGKSLWIAGIAIAVPAVAGALLRRRAEAPQAPSWGRSHRFSGRHGELAFQELGSGPAVVLLHSFGPGYDGSSWRGVAEHLAERHRVLVPDLPGWGRSPARGGLQPGRYLETLADFLAGAVREPAVLVGAGLAAAYAVEIAAQEPQLVAALALLCPLGLGRYPQGPQPHLARGIRGARGAVVPRLLRIPLVRASVLDLLTARKALEHHLRREVYAAPERVDAGLLDHHYRASHTRDGRAALAAYLRGDLWLDVSESVAALQVPVWLGWGRKSKLPPVEAADLWLRELPTLELEVFEGSGALPHSEEPFAVARALSGFVADLGW